jgi:hypothetical protein
MSQWNVYVCSLSNQAYFSEADSKPANRPYFSNFKSFSRLSRAFAQTNESQFLESLRLEEWSHMADFRRIWVAPSS